MLNILWCAAHLASTKCHLLLVVVCAAGVAGCESGTDYRQLAGATMGTYYRVTADCPAGTGLDLAVETELGAVNAEMSTYDPESTLSRFNASAPGDWFAVGFNLLEVVTAAVELSDLSEGAFDVTVGPLVNLWGFGPVPRSADSPPARKELDLARDRVGYQYLRLRDDPPALAKTRDLYVDLSAIAKGHGVDRLAALLDAAGCPSYLVDIGGELRVAGQSPRGGLWQVGIEVPDPDTLGAVQRVLALSDAAVATSGDYRNFLEHDGHRLSHTIDPRSGAPVEHALASVSVVAPSAMWADGYATALNVLGPDAGLVLAEQLNLQAMLIIRTPTGFEERYTEAMRNFLDSR